MKRREQRYPHKPDESQGLKIKRLIKAKTATQAQLLDALDDTALVIATGPAGTGKTFLAVYAALKALVDGRVDKVVLTRPVVEAGEQLGFLPGDLEEKLHPYLIPLMDAVNDLVGPTMAKKLREDGIIEIAPLAFMRGRTFNDCFLVADEMQNATISQMKLLATRMGENATFSLNGDPAQCDLPSPKDNGIAWMAERLKGVDHRVSVVEFRNGDIVRSEMVKMLMKHIGD